MLLRRLHEQSQTEVMARARAQFHGSNEEFLTLAEDYDTLAPRLRGRFLETLGLSSEDFESSQGTALSLAVSAETGRFLRNMTLSHKPARILELGSSCGVSTLYFAEALRTLGSGMVIATELDPVKCAQLRDHVRTAGVDVYVDLREGDVFQAVSELDGTFDMVFIDVWANTYLDLFKQTERLLRPGSIVLADSMYTAEDAVRPYKQYLDGNPRFSTTTLDFESGIEFTVVVS
ncbi:tRNA 5-hydroxyuridine methyltransferase [Paraburkholderia gardini]|nr:tRNA 5-hydroxyuridine methyltransferase [Paraburkholderia gardini]